MSMGRYWIFFVIVAVGLVLSWGQVGRKTEHELRERPVDFLSVESGCDPMHAPCAAYAGERAMVLGPEQGGLLLKLAGIDPASVASVEAVLLDPGGEAVGFELDVCLRRSDSSVTCANDRAGAIG